MEANHKPNRLHPLVAIAAVSVTVLSLAGVAAITGLLPTSHGESGPGSAAVASLMAPAATSTAAQAGAGLSPDAAKANAAASAAAAPKAQLAAEETEKPVPKAIPKQTTQRHHTPRPASPDYSQKSAQARPICYDCGRVESVQAVQEQGQASGVGVVAGAVLGGVLGNQIGGGNGRKLATVAGAVGGGFAGNEVEKRSRATSSYRVQVRMEDGSVRSYKQTTDNWRVGDRVRIVNGELSLRG